MDSDSKPYFKRVDLGRYLGIVEIRATYRDVKTTSRNLLIPHASDACLSKDKNDQDAFVDLEGALEIVVRSGKPKAVELTKWLTLKGHQKAIDAERHNCQQRLDLINKTLNEQRHAKQYLEPCRVIKNVKVPQNTKKTRSNTTRCYSKNSRF